MCEENHVGYHWEDPLMPFISSRNQRRLADAKDRQVQLETVKEANKALIDRLAESIERAP